MHKTRNCLSLAAVAAFTLGLGGNLPADRALAENSLSAASRITAVYRVDLAGFNLGNFNLTTMFRGDDYEMRGEARFSILQGPRLPMERHDGEHRPRHERRPRARRCMR